VRRHGERDTGANIPTHLGCWSKGRGKQNGEPKKKHHIHHHEREKRCACVCRVLLLLPRNKMQKCGNRKSLCSLRAESRGGGTPAVVSLPLDEKPICTNGKKEKKTIPDAYVRKGKKAWACAIDGHATWRDGFRLSKAVSFRHWGFLFRTCVCVCCVAVFRLLEIHTHTPHRKAKKRIAEQKQKMAAPTAPIELLLSNTLPPAFDSPVPKHRSRSPRQVVSGQWMQCS